MVTKPQEVVELDVRFILEQLGIDSNAALKEIFLDSPIPPMDEDDKKS